MMNYFKCCSILLVITTIISCNNKKAQEPLLLDVDEVSIRQEILKFEGNSPVLLNVWATWCAPCIEEFPYLMKLKDEYGDDFELLLINADFPEAKPDAIEFLKKQKVHFQSYYKTGKDNDFIPAVSDDWTGALPFTLILDQNGEIVDQWEGKRDYKTFESRLQEAIGH